MKLATRILLIICLVLTSVGCKNHSDLEDYGFIQILGFDYVDPDHYNITAAVNESFVKSKNIKTMVYSANKVSHPFQALDIISSTSTKQTTFVQLKVILFSEEFARKRGLFDTLLPIYNDERAIGDRVLIGIVKGSVRDLLQSKRSSVDSAEYIHQLLQLPTNTIYKTEKIHHFIFQATSNTQDPVVPYLEKQGSKIQVTQSALFQQDKMIDYLSKPMSTFVRLFDGSPPPEWLVLSNNKQTLAMRVLDSAGKINVIQPNSKHPTITVKLNVKTYEVSYTGPENLMEHKAFNRVTHQMEAHFEKQIADQIKKWLAMGIDPLAIREQFRYRYPGNWTQQIGCEKLKASKLQVKVNLSITALGMLNSEGNHPR